MVRLFVSIATLATVVGFIACSQQEHLGGGTGGSAPGGGGTATGGSGGSGDGNGPVAGRGGWSVDGNGPVPGGGGFRGDGSGPSAFWGDGNGPGGFRGDGSGPSAFWGDGNGPIAGHGGVGGAGDTCTGDERPLERLRPQVLILLDRSANMNNDIDDNGCGTSGTAGCGLESKWSIITAGINEALPDKASGADWGLKLVAGPGSNSCAVSSTPDVPVGSASSDAVAAALAAQTTSDGEVSNGGRAPVALAEAAAASYLAGLGGPNPKYIMYIGDTLPNCASGGTDPSADDSTGALLAVQQAFATGIRTIVASIGTITLSGAAAVDQTMFQMAQQGGGPDYLVATEPDVVGVLGEVSHVSCTFALGDAPAVGGSSASSFEILAGGNLVSRDQTHQAGWDYDSPAMTSISIYGFACEDIQFGNTSLVTLKTCR